MYNGTIPTPPLFPPSGAAIDFEPAPDGRGSQLYREVPAAGHLSWSMVGTLLTAAGRKFILAAGRSIAYGADAFPGALGRNS